jgi:hypothetical protein
LYPDFLTSNWNETIIQGEVVCATFEPDFYIRKDGRKGGAS